MISIVPQNLMHLLTTYGYWAVLIFIAIESTGIPFPGETMLLIAAIYAGTTHRLAIILVIVAAASGAILGDNLGFLLGRAGGYRLLRRYGPYIRLDERKLKLGQYLFMKHGGKVVFFGRFVAVLRAWAAFLAGTNRMQWPGFLLFNALGGIIWATLFGLGGYFLGDNIHRITGSVAIISILLATLVLIAFLIFVRRNEHRLQEEAERALPEPLDAPSYKKQAREQETRPSAPTQVEATPTHALKNRAQTTHIGSTMNAEQEQDNGYVPVKYPKSGSPALGVLNNKGTAASVPSQLK